MECKRKHRGENGNALHTIGFLRVCLDDHFLVVLPPSVIIGNNSNLRSDIIGNIVLVSSLIVKGNAAVRQWLETEADIYLWPTRDTYVQIREAEINKVLYKAENAFSG